MGTVVKLGGGGPKKDDQRPTAKRAAEPSNEGLRVQLNPAMAAGIVVALVVLVASIWFGVNRASTGAASTPMMDTSSETPTGTPEQHANGMDTSTGAPPGARTNNGMDTGTGR